MGRERILIVEDETITALHLQWQLTRFGYPSSSVAESGHEAIQMAEELNPDLILMDVKLAGAMDGVEASRRIQEKHSIPIVYLTAYPDVFLKSPTSMQEPGICITKPFSAPALQKTIDIALRGTENNLT